MIAVIFEAWPVAGQQQSYLDLAAALRPQLEKLEGFVAIERFQSLTDPSKLLSLSFFEDEEAVARWRNLSSHRATQARGIDKVFDDYRLRVASVVRDYGKFDRAGAPSDSLAAHVCGTGRAKANAIACLEAGEEDMMKETENFLDRLEPSERAIANRLREIVSAAAPDAIEGFKWNAPSFIHAGDHKLTLGRNKDGGIRLVVHRGARPRPVESFSFLDSEGLAEWPSPDRGVMNFSSVEEVDLRIPELRSFVVRWLEAVR